MSVQVVMFDGALHDHTCVEQPYTFILWWRVDWHLWNPFNRIWSHSLVVPVYFAALSLAIGCWGVLSKNSVHKSSQPNAFVIPGKFKNIHANVAQQGAALASLGVLRFVCCLGLTILCLVTAVRASGTRSSRDILSLLPPISLPTETERSTALGTFWVDAMQALFYVRLVRSLIPIPRSPLGQPRHIILDIHFHFSLLSVVLSIHARKQARLHLNTLLLVPFAIYFYRDVYPLCTFTLLPFDTLDPIMSCADCQ